MTTEGVTLNFDKVFVSSDVVLNFTDSNDSESKTVSYTQIISLIRTQLQLENNLAYELANAQALLMFKRGEFNRSLDVAKQ